MNLRFLAALAIILAITMVYAADVELKEFYGPGELLSGTISMNLTNADSDSEFSAIISGNNQSVKLIDFLNNSGASYSCMPSDCSSTYSSSFPSATKKITNGAFALKIPSGKDIEILKVNFSIKGNAYTKSCGVAPVKIDILNDGTIDWQYLEPTEDESPYRFCGELHSNPSYNPSVSQADYNIISEKYCEKIELISSKRFLLGADILTKGDNVSLFLSISDGENDASCQIPWVNGLQTCEVNFTAPEKKQYYICIESDSDDSETMILGETQSPTCGQYGSSEFECNSSSIDYALYAQPSWYKSFTDKLEFSNSLFEEFSNNELESYIQDYLDSKYGADCSAGCTIPINVSSITETEFADLTLRYASNLGALKPEKNFYSISTNAAKINMSGQALNIESAGFKIPAIYGNISLKLMLGDKELYNDKIRIEKIPRISFLSPLIVSASIDTQFTVTADSPKGINITSYEWDFGDGATDYTELPYSSHIYSIGNYTLRIKAIDADGLYNQKDFLITAEEPVKIVNMTIERKKSNLNLLKKEIEKIPLWYRNLIKDIVDVSLIDTKLKMFEADFQKPDADFVSIKLGLDDLFVPNMISEEKYESPMLSEPQSSYIAKIDNSEVDEEALNEKIKAWENANVGITAFYSVKSASEDSNKEELATEYALEIKSKSDASFDDAYLIIIPPTKDIVFKSNYTEYSKQNVDGATGFILSIDNSAKTIEFAIKGNHPAEEFTIFASPGPGSFGPEEGVVCGDKICDKAKGESYAFCPADCSKPYGTATIWSALILAIIGLGIFAIWKYYAALYDKDLRQKLFKPVEDFYKISFFISNAMNRGTGEKEIIDSLEKAGWKKSQIDYAMRKVAESTRAMQKKSILDYVRREINLRKEEKEIRNKLIESGWKSNLVDWAFKTARKQKNP